MTKPKKRSGEDLSKALDFFMRHLVSEGYSHEQIVALFSIGSVESLASIPCMECRELALRQTIHETREKFRLFPSAAACAGHEIVDRGRALQ